MSNHTPAPWTVREVSGLAIPGQRAFAIDFNEDQEQVVDWVYEEADAHLIAAAPDLLEAVEAMIDAYEHEASIDNPSLLRARAALAKARGES